MALCALILGLENTFKAKTACAVGAWVGGTFLGAWQVIWAPKIPQTPLKNSCLSAATLKVPISFLQIKITNRKTASARARPRLGLKSSYVANC